MGASRTDRGATVPPDLGREIERLALLEDPVRRSLYVHVVGEGDYVSRDQAAAAVGVARGLAAFHLDKLADEGLLDVVYRRPAGRSGPGAGRPAKLYRRSQRQVSVSVPHRDYELLARLLAAALEPEPPPAVAGELAEAARRAGTALGRAAWSLAGTRPSRRRLLEAALEVLSRQGFEPRRQNGEVVLRSCPFQAVALDHTSLVCPANLALVEGLVAALDVIGLSAVLRPRPDACCVTLHLPAR